VMEYVEGENLASVLKRERPPLEKILAITRQLASALSAAHAKGIIHRDLKPANIQMTPDGSAKILDFGVAQAVSALATSATTPAAALTVPMTTSTQGYRSVMHPGTPAYMSPEQMFGRKIDQRSDIYSLGVIVYEMATGHRPYSADDPLELVITLSRNFLRPGDADAALPAQVGDVIAKMLAVKPDDRYQTAAELETALVALTAVPPLAAVAAPLRFRLRVAGRVAAVGLATIAGVTLLGYIESAAFNVTLGRIAPFDRESPAIWIEFGLRGLVVPLVYTVAIFIALAAIKFIVRLLSLSRGIERLLTTGMTSTTRLSARLGLNDPLVLGQAVAGVGVILLVALLWYFREFANAFASYSISELPAARYLPLQPTGRAKGDAQLYRLLLTLLCVGFGMAALRIRRLRASDAIPQGGAGLALVSAMFVVSLVMCVFPYRIVWKNDAPRLDVAGERCFAIGSAGDDLLIHCPDRVPPRNRIVKRTDAAVRDTGLVQNIFTPLETPHP
jgi:hypothetical protein